MSFCCETDNCFKCFRTACKEFAVQKQACFYLHETSGPTAYDPRFTASVPGGSSSPTFVPDSPAAMPKAGIQSFKDRFTQPWNLTRKLFELLIECIQRSTWLRTALQNDYFQTGLCCGLNRSIVFGPCTDGRTSVQDLFLIDQWHWSPPECLSTIACSYRLPFLSKINTPFNHEQVRSMI